MLLLSLDFLFYILLSVLEQTGAQAEMFQGKGGFVELQHLDKDFVTNTQKIKTRFWMEDLTQEWT